MLNFNNTYNIATVLLKMLYKVNGTKWCRGSFTEIHMLNHMLTNICLNNLS